MKKILAVARTEYFIAATSKAFILGILMMPVFMGGALVVQHLAQDQFDTTPRKIAIVDHTGTMFPALQQQVKHYNEHEIFSQEPDSEPKQTAATFELENAEPGLKDQDALKVQLSDRVKAGDLFAFAIIERGVYESSSNAVVRYHSQTPTYQRLPNWLRRAVNGEVKRHRTQAMGLSPTALQELAQQTQVKSFGLVSINEDGKVDDAKEENQTLSRIIPFAGLMLMFMMIMSVAPAMLNNVLEEKMQKISEFLVSSVTPYQLMMGKLAGAVGIGITLSVIYLSAAFGLAHYFEIADRIPISLYVWFAYFLFIALVIFGSIFSAIGAACSEIRDAQSLMTPVMLLVIIPVMCIGPILDSPSSTFSKAVSLFPPATPMLMFARIAMQPGPALWEIVLAAILSAAFAMACVWAAGKVFRVGILSQGQAPSFAKLVGWVLSK